MSNSCSIDSYPAGTPTFGFESLSFGLSIVADQLIHLTSAAIVTPEPARRPRRTRTPEAT